MMFLRYKDTTLKNQIAQLEKQHKHIFLINCLQMSGRHSQRFVLAFLKMVPTNYQHNCFTFVNTMDVNFTLVHKRAGLLMQVIIAVVLAYGGMLLCKLLHAEESRAYFAAFVAIIFYTIINVVVSIAHTSFVRYTMISFYVYIGLVVVLLLSAKLFSGISIWSLEEYRMMLVSISIFYVVASLLVRLIRFIYEAAEKDF